MDPLLAEAHDALAIAYARDGQWGRSEKSFRRAIELDPSRSESYDDFAMYLLLPLGRIEEAVHQVKVAEKTDSLSPEVHSITGYVLISAGQYDEAARVCQNAPDSTECLGRVRLGQGRIDEAVQILSAASNPRYFGHALGRAGRGEDAEKLAATVATNPFQQALIFAGLGATYAAGTLTVERMLPGAKAMTLVPGLRPASLPALRTTPEHSAPRGVETPA